jgi:hypothetical protein
MTIFTGPPASAIRNLPISPELRAVLDAAAEVAGVDTILIVSGGQPGRGEGTRRTGSTRHDYGRAADIQLIVNGAAARFTDKSADAVVRAFVTAAAAHGATGIGAGVEYMGDHTIHVGFGTSIGDKTKLTWGAGGLSANAPEWLRNAAQAGWASPASDIAALARHNVRTTGRYEVIARGGLKLRGGPGTDYASDRTLPLGTPLNVVKIDSAESSWVGVDLEGGGLLDGYVYAAFLTEASNPEDGEATDEPN